MSEITRPPVVTILGHVDHGKTTLLDFIRKTKVVEGEHGGITQAIGAYQIAISDKGQATSSLSFITFIDTPGHAAFEKMRLRGAEAADIAVLVIAIDDGVMPQTVEAIKHIQKSTTPMVVAVNKVDLLSTLPSPDGKGKIDSLSPELKIAVEKIKRKLSDQKVLVEEYGGDVPVVLISAKTGKGVDELLETINLVAQMQEFKGDPQKSATGVILEANLDKFKGPLATVLVRNGSLQKGDIIKAGSISGKIKGMFDWSGDTLDFAGPSMPVEVLGFEKVPPVGARINEENPQEEEIKRKFSTLVDKLKNDETELLRVVVKADKGGSLEVIKDILEKFNEKKEHLRIISLSTGNISESDVEMAASSKGIVIGFNVKVTPVAQKIADVSHTLVRVYNIIYELMDEMEDVVEGLLKPGVYEEVFGKCQIIAQFPYGEKEKIAGCKILEGTFSKGLKVRIVRGKDHSTDSTSSLQAGSRQVIGETKIKSLKKAKEEVQKVEKGNECGMMFEPVVDFQIGDIVESFRTY